MAREIVLYRAHPVMFRGDPLRFILYCVLCLALIGFPLLLFWWLSCLGTQLTVTDSKVILRSGIFSKTLNEVRLAHIRNVQLRQRFLQRILNVGYIGVSTAAQSGLEIEVYGIPSPARVKRIIDERSGS